MMGSSGNRSGAGAGNQQRAAQQEQDRRDARKRRDEARANPSESEQPAAQTSRRAEPAPPLPRQHLDKLGQEADMELKPRFLAPDYRGSGKLAGQVAIV